MKDGRFVVATEDGLAKLRELAERVQREIWIKEAEEDIAQKEKQRQSPLKTEPADLMEQIHCGILPKGTSISIRLRQFTLSLKLPMETKGSDDILLQLPECAKRFPAHACTLTRRGKKRKRITLPIAELIPLDPEVPDLDEAFLERVFNWHEQHRTELSSVPRQQFALPSHQPKDKRWYLVIRIGVPTGGGSAWSCEPCSRSVDDESVVVSFVDGSAAKLDRSQRESVLKAIYTQCQSAASHWEPLSRIQTPTDFSSTAIAAPRIEVSPAEIVQLLTHSMDLLEAERVSVQLPRSLLRRDCGRIQKKCVVTDDLPRKPGVLTRDVVLRLQIDLAIDGEPLTLDELQELACIREPLLKVRGNWVYADSGLKAELERLAQQVLHARTSSLPAAEIVGKLLGDELREASGADLIRSDLQLDASGLQQLMDAFHNQSPPSIAIPSELNATLRHYQEFGFRWLAMMGNLRLGACLADDMGLGKTIQTLAWLLHRRESGIKDPALLICPTSVMANWEREARKFAPGLRVYRHHGANRPDSHLRFFQASHQTHLVVTSYNLLQRDQELFQNVSWKWSAVILDEAQNIKNVETEQSKAARKLSNCALSRLVLTGTPVENGARDLWPIMEFLNPGMLGTWRQYVKRVVSPIEQGNGINRRKALREKIAPFILRRKKTDPGIAPELPPKIEQTVWCSLTREQAAWYKAALSNAETALASKNRTDRQGAILRLLPELKQVCNGVAALARDESNIYTRSGKIQQLAEMLVTVVESGEKALVFSQYPGQFDKLSDFLMDWLKAVLGRPFGVLTLTGDDSVHSREETQRQFAEDDRFPIVLISLRAGGTGLNMQAASHVFHLDRWWNAAVEDQATDRAWRIGQERTVHVHKFVCRGTLEERIDDLISRKRELAKDLLGDVDEQTIVQELAGLDGPALMDVLRLDEGEAIDDEM